MTLATRKSARVCLDSIGKSDPSQKVYGPVTPFNGADAGIQQPEFDVLTDRPVLEEEHILEHQAETLGALGCSRVIVQVIDIEPAQ